MSCVGVEGGMLIFSQYLIIVSILQALFPHGAYKRWKEAHMEGTSQLGHVYIPAGLMGRQWAQPERFGCQPRG